MPFALFDMSKHVEYALFLTVLSQLIIVRKGSLPPPTPEQPPTLGSTPFQNLMQPPQNWGVNRTFSHPQGIIHDLLVTKIIAYSLRRTFES